MSANISNNFIDLWNSEVHQVFQQSGSKLRNAVRTVTGVTGRTHKFPYLGAVTANTKTRTGSGSPLASGDVTPLNPDMNIATATLADYYAPLYIDKLDELKSNADYRREYVAASAMAQGRRMDDTIIAALDAATPTATVTPGLAWSSAELLQVKRELDENDVPAEDRFLVVSPQAMAALLANTEVVSADYQTFRALSKGEVDTAYGFKWIMTTRLSSAGSPILRKCYAFHKSAVGCAVGYDIQTEVNYVPQKASYLVNTMLSLGSVAIDETGIVEIDFQEVA